MKTLTLATVIAMTGTVVAAQETLDTVEPVETAETVEIVEQSFDIFDPIAVFDAICNAQDVLVLSENLIAECAIGTAPDAITDGSRFPNRSIGSELNVLYANRALWYNED